jgi:hypothetical protein
MAARVDADICQQWFQSFNISDSRGARRLPESARLYCTGGALTSLSD